MECAKKRADPIISVSENGRTFRLDNPKRRDIVQVKVDGCLIKDERERCDYLFEVPTPTIRVCYVELKGKYIEKAIQQIISTLQHTQKDYAGHDKEAYIVCSRVPAASPASQALQIRLQRDYKARLKIKTTELTVNVP